MCGRVRARGPWGPGGPGDALPAPQVAEILGAILAHLPVVDPPEVRQRLVEGVLLLAHHHRETVLTSLLRQPLPMQRWAPRLTPTALSPHLPCEAQPLGNRAPSFVNSDRQFTHLLVPLDLAGLVSLEPTRMPPPCTCVTRSLLSRGPFPSQPGHGRGHGD